MGGRRTNPVLEVLGETRPIEAGRKFPSHQPLLFGQRRWRAYYHCHKAPKKPAQEHGHFHLFTRIDGEKETGDWAHAVALSMDTLGQPLRWFVVNRWVTGGPWLSGEAFANSRRSLGVHPHSAPVARYLEDMLLAHDEVLTQLFQARDAHLTQIKADGTADAIFEQRDVYELADQPVDLLETLHRALS